MSGSREVEEGTGGAAVTLEDSGTHATLRLRHPPVNVLTLPVIGELRDAVEDLAGREDLAAVVVRGTSETGFSAGVDVAAHAPERVEEMLGSFHGLIRALWRLPQVTVAALQGRALGGGLELAAACDLLLATEDTRLGQPEIRLACFPPVAAAVLPSRIGHHRAAELVLLGREIDAATAASWGLLNGVVAAGELDREVERTMAELGGLSRAALRVTRRALLVDREDWERRLEATEELYLRKLASTADMAEGVRAFEEKRPPRWEHG